MSDASRGSSQNYIPTYYRDTLHENQQRQSLTHDIETDVCIIGGGLAGLSTATGLLEKGVKNVTLIEANRIGWGASGRNGGFVAKGYAAGYRPLVKKVGLDHTRALHKLATKGRSQIKQRIQNYNIDCDPVVNGVLGVSWNNHPESVREYVDWMRESFNAPLEFWTKEQVRECCKTKQYFEGFYSPEDYQFHPLNYVHGLAKAIESQGGQIYEGAKALSIKDQGSGYLVETAAGTIKCNQVVLCCSIYVDDLNKKLKYAAFPVYTFVMVTKPIEKEILDQALNTDYAIFDNRYAQDYYRRLPDNRILWGGRVSVSGVPDDLANIMLKDLVKVYPQLKSHVEADYAWGGELCYAPHKMPQIGQLKPGYWYNTCFGGHGLVPTSVGGEVVSDAIANNGEEYKLFEPFSKLWFAGGPLSPYVAQSVYYLWRARDILISLNK
ncbi:MAG: FAD-binding oxidoreductase [Pseudomonadota bacterium]